jgi:excisionase family DNA binding protein
MKPITISISDMCAGVGCGRTKAYDLIRRGEVEAVKIGRRTVVTVASIEAMIKRKTVRQP